MAFNNQSFKHVDVIYGVEDLEGFGEGDDVVTITPNTEQFTQVVGAKGDVARSQTSDNSCLVKVKLLETSKSNKVLMALYNLDRETGANVLPLIVINKENGKLSTINNAWIVGYPEEVLGQGVNMMEWTIAGDFLTKTIV